MRGFFILYHMGTCPASRFAPRGSPRYPLYLGLTLVTPFPSLSQGCRCYRWCKIEYEIPNERKKWVINLRMLKCFLLLPPSPTPSIPSHPYLSSFQIVWHILLSWLYPVECPENHSENFCLLNPKCEWRVQCCWH